MLSGEVAGESAKVLREVPTVVLALLKLAHDAVALEELLGPEALISDLLLHLSRQHLATLLRL